MKLMPLCAKSPEAFGFMLDEIPRLFGNLGRKLYTHLPASPATTALMQGGGWRLEGLMPAAYHPDLVPRQEEVLATLRAALGVREGRDCLAKGNPHCDMTDPKPAVR
ncbi:MULTISPECIES: hypothetical protein [unclassified Streptomyces]|uniref:hypothetical protein n=1 Tax=unclassified Streptomyces TaxID=2593676 RepID=UPI003404A4B3